MQSGGAKVRSGNGNGAVPEQRVIWCRRQCRLPCSRDRGYIQRGNTRDRKGHLLHLQVAFPYLRGWASIGNSRHSALGAIPADLGVGGDLEKPPPTPKSLESLRYQRYRIGPEVYQLGSSGPAPDAQLLASYSVLPLAPATDLHCHAEVVVA